MRGFCRKILVFFGLFIPVVLGTQSESDLPPSNSSLYIGVMLQSLSYAKKLHPVLAIPGAEALNTGYQTYQWIKDLNGQKLDAAPLNITYAAVQLLVTASLATGVTIPGLFPLSYVSWGATYTPVLATYFLGGSLDGIKGNYSLDLFTDPKNAQTTYLSCEYKPKKIWTWAKAEDLPGQVERLYANNSIVLKGRWIKEDNRYVFGTVDDPLKVQAACINALSRHLYERKETLTSLSDISFSAGNTKLTNGIPIVFYSPRISLHPKSQKYRKIIVKSAILIKSQD